MEICCSLVAIKETTQILNQCLKIFHWSGMTITKAMQCGIKSYPTVILTICSSFTSHTLIIYICILQRAIICNLNCIFAWSSLSWKRRNPSNYILGQLLQKGAKVKFTFGNNNLKNYLVSSNCKCFTVNILEYFKRTPFV